MSHNIFRFCSSKTGRIFFFFQAEDGIRDYKVTGVQTCALPIYVLHHLGVVVSREERLVRAAVLHRQPADEVRSEERRVGKECRSRWPALYYKKKENRVS